MPKYIEKPTTIGGWVFIFFVLGLFSWFIWQAPIILVIVPILVYIEIKNKNERKVHFRNLLLDRENDSICTFSRSFDCKEIDTWVIRAVYEQLQNYLKNEKAKFPIRPQDDIYTDLKIDDEDFEMDIVEEIAFRAGRTLENSEENRYYGKANIVENLVYFFNEQPKSSKT